MIEKAIMYFSGGKDSTAMLYYLDDLLDQIDVVFNDTGAILPEVLDHIYSTCERLKARLTVIHPPQDIRAFHRERGLPADIVPFERTAEYRDFMHAPVKDPIQSYFSCCYQMIMKPLDDYSRAHGYNLIIRGSKKSDERVGAPDGLVHDGVTYLSPLWDWSHDDVFAYLKQRGVDLPYHYRYFPDSLDCFICTGHLKHYGLERLKFIKKHHPDKWPELFDNLCKVDTAVTEEYADFRHAVVEGIKYAR